MDQHVIRRIQSETFHRSATFERGAADATARTVPLSFSSETPVERWFGMEILDHSPGAVRLGRLRTMGPVLMDHDQKDQVAVIHDVSVGTDRKGRAVVRFGKSARAEEIFQDVCDGIRGNVSCRYVIHAMRYEGEENGTEVYRATEWEPLEISIVSIPADTAVGVGRSRAAEKEHSMDRTTSVGTLDNEGAPDPVVQERQRVQAIREMGDTYRQRELARQFCENGGSLDEFRAVLLERIQPRPLGAPMRERSPLVESGRGAGAFPADLARYSFSRAVAAIIANDWSRAGFELECHQECLRTFAQDGRSPKGNLVIPLEAFTARALTKGGAAAGAALVGTDHMPGMFVEALRPVSRVLELGARMISGLRGDADIPRRSASAQAQWVAEGSAAAEGAPSYDGITLTPRSVSAWCTLSRKMVLQALPEVEELTRQDLLAVIASALDLATIAGTGSGNNQPTGILGTTGIGSVAGGSNGAAPTWSHIVKLETEVATDNADVGKLGYLTNAKVRGKLKETFRNATYGEVPIWGDDDRMNGRPAVVSNNVPSNLTKGTANAVCSAIIFGNWNDLLIGQWGNGIDVLVDPYTGATKGEVRVISFLDADVAVRHAESFAAMKDALTP